MKIKIKKKYADRVLSFYNDLISKEESNEAILKKHLNKNERAFWNDILNNKILKQQNISFVDRTITFFHNSYYITIYLDGIPLDEGFYDLEYKSEVWITGDFVNRKIKEFTETCLYSLLDYTLEFTSNLIPA